MKEIRVYDIEAERLEELAEKNDMTIAELVEMFMEYEEEMLSDHDLKGD